MRRIARGPSYCKCPKCASVAHFGGDERKFARSFLLELADYVVPDRFQGDKSDPVMDLMLDRRMTFYQAVLYLAHLHRICVTFADEES